MYSIYVKTNKETTVKFYGQVANIPDIAEVIKTVEMFGNTVNEVIITVDTQIQEDHNVK